RRRNLRSRTRLCPADVHVAGAVRRAAAAGELYLYSCDRRRAERRRSDRSAPDHAAGHCAAYRQRRDRLRERAVQPSPGRHVSRQVSRRAGQRGGARPLRRQPLPARPQRQVPPQPQRSGLLRMDQPEQRQVLRLQYLRRPAKSPPVRGVQLDDEGRREGDVLMRRALSTAALAALLAGCATTSPVGLAPVEVTASAETTPVGTANADAADDPAIWRNAANPAASLIVGTDKKAGLHVYDLTGRTLFSETSGLINNVDLTELPDGRVIVVASDRNDPGNAMLRAWEMDKASGALTLLGAVPGGKGEGYGFCLRRD